MIREDRRRGVFVDGLSEWVVRSPAEVYGLMMRGAQQVGRSWRTQPRLARGCSSGHGIVLAAETTSVMHR